jgi:hypothetical protein
MGVQINLFPVEQKTIQFEKWELMWIFEPEREMKYTKDGQNNIRRDI